MHNAKTTDQKVYIVLRYWIKKGADAVNVSGATTLKDALGLLDQLWCLKCLIKALLCCISIYLITMY